MKTRHPVLLTLAILALLLPATTGFAAEGESQGNGKGEAGSEKPGTIEGEVIAVQQQTRTQNGGEAREITVRTREQQEIKLRLGPGSDGAPQYQKGDQIRAQVQTGRNGQTGETGKTGQGDGAYQVRTMTNLRTGRQESFGDGEATAVRQQTRQRNRDGSGDGTQRARTRQRTHEPGTGGCPRGDAGSRGAGQGGGGQGRGGNGSGGGGGGGGGRR